MKKKYRRKRKLTKKAIIISIIACIILILIMLIDTINSLKEQEDKENENDNIAQLSSENNEANIDKTIFEKYNCKETKKEENDTKIEINTKFEKELYDENDNSNKKYFEDMIEELVNIYEKDFSIYDKSKEIKIDVNVNSKADYKYKINSIEDYFETTEENNKSIKEYEKIETIKNTVKYREFNKFINNKWSIKGAGVEIKEKGEGFVSYGNYKILTDNIFINTIILNSKFEEEIFEGIKVGDSFEKVKEKLGEPIFEQENMIGYKTNQCYTFFYNDEVAIYPNQKFNNNKLEKLIEEYLKKDKKFERKYFAYELLNSYEDFKSYIDDNNLLNLYSSIRGIKIQITSENEIITNIYNNYNINKNTKENIRTGNFKTNFEKDLVYETELNRK